MAAVWNAQRTSETAAVRVLSSSGKFPDKYSSQDPWLFVRRREILVPRHMSQLALERILKPWARQEDAEVRQMGRFVRRYKTEGENMHWHVTGLKKGMGTVEVTCTPSLGRITVLVHDNRRGFWAGQAYLRLAREIMKRTKETRS